MEKPKKETTAEEFYNSAKNEENKMRKLQEIERAFLRVVARWPISQWQEVHGLSTKSPGIYTNKRERHPDGNPGDPYTVKPSEVLAFLTEVKTLIERGINEVQIMDFIDSYVVNGNISGRDIMEAKNIRQEVSFEEDIPF